MTRKILFLVPYPLQESPSQRFRFEQYFSLLRENGFNITVQSFLKSNNWQLFFRPGNSVSKVWALIRGFSSRLVSLVQAPFYEFIFIHREATPVGPPFFEWFISRVLGKRVIYDFDDAIWLTDRSKESMFLRLLKYRAKVKLITKLSYKVSCGNDYLSSYAKRYNHRVIFNPTTIDTQSWHNPDKFPVKISCDKIVIGWTGSHSTLKYLYEIEPVLQTLEERYKTLEFLVIADRKPTLNLTSLSFIQWQEKSEIEDLMKFDIGIMPLPDDEWAKGKCGFKALQYMALRVPAVASPVGVNLNIIDHGINGFLCNSLQDWELALSRLIEDAPLRKVMGSSGRQKIEEHYSVSSNSANFLSLFE